MFNAVLPDKPTEVHYREQLLAAGEYMNGLQKVDAEKRDDGWKNDMRSAVEFVRFADPTLTALERGSAKPAPQGPLNALHPQNVGSQSFGDQMTDRDEYRNAGSEGWSSARALELEIRGSLFANNPGEFRVAAIDSTTASPYIPVASTAIAPRPRQMRLFLRDVIDVAETGLQSVPYIRETSPASSEYGASAVLEGNAKPEVAMNWTLDEAPVRKIAAWVTVTSEVIEDAATLRSYIDGRLAYMLAIREEFEILNGSGTAPHLKGILQYADLQTQTGTADKPVALGLAIGKIENVDGDADGIAMNPLDFWAMVTTRSATEFDGGAIGTAPFGSPGRTIWGLPTVRSRAITQGTALVGSYRLGATLFDRMATRIVVGNQHSDYFTNNKVAILAEERVGLAVHRPDFFVKVTF